MKYKIKRFSSILLEKLFGSKPEEINGDIFMEGIKINEMWRTFTDNEGHEGVNTEHWVNHMAEKIWRVGDYFKGKYQCFFAPLDDSELRFSVGNFKNKYAKGRSSKEIMKDEINHVLTMKESGKNKYNDVIKAQGGLSGDIDFYIHLFKYIALSFSGQYKGDDPIGSDYYFIESTKVNYDKIGPRFNSPRDLQNFLQQLFVNYLGPNDYLN